MVDWAKIAKWGIEAKPLLAGLEGTAAGGILGAAYGGLSDNRSMLGEAFRGAAVGGMLGLGGGAAARYGGVGLAKGLKINANGKSMFNSTLAGVGRAAKVGWRDTKHNATRAFDDIFGEGITKAATKKKAKLASNAAVNPI